MKVVLSALLTILFVSQSCVQYIHGAKILSVAFISTKSHKIVYDPLLQQLAARGHQVTVLSPIISKKNITNMREILTVDSEEFLEKLPNLFEMKERNEKYNPFLMVDNFINICKQSYEVPQVKALQNEQFDLIIHQPLANECTAGFLHKFNTSMILIVPLSAPSSLVSTLGSPSPLSFVPNLFTSYGEKMNFWERFMNFGWEVVLNGIQKYYFVPKMENLYRSILGDPTIPSYEDIIKNVSLVLSNSHFSMGGRRPFLPDVIEVGGMHCRPAKPLPQVSKKT